MAVTKAWFIEQVRREARPWPSSKNPPSSSHRPRQIERVGDNSIEIPCRASTSVRRRRLAGRPGGKHDSHRLKNRSHRSERREVQRNSAETSECSAPPVRIRHVQVLESRARWGIERQRASYCSSLPSLRAHKLPQGQCPSCSRNLLCRIFETSRPRPGFALFLRRISTGGTSSKR